MPQPSTGLAHRELAVYLKDHLSGAVAGVELAKRAARNARGQEHAPRLATLAAEIEADRHSLLRIMNTLGVPVSRAKASAAWAGEKAGRFKLNGRLLRRAPLSSLVELEGLLLGVEGKTALWESLSAVADHESRLDPQRLAELLARARVQAVELRRLHHDVALNVLAPGAGRPAAPPAGPSAGDA